MEIHTDFWWLLNLLFLIRTLRVHGEYTSIFETPSGGIVGTIEHVNDSYHTIDVQQFLGIPFARPPIGDLRFKKTVKNRRWHGIRYCEHMEKSCVRYMPALYPWPWVPVEYHFHENCLYLNMWVPKDASPQNKKSVLIWIHGGNYFMGSNVEEMYDGRVIAAIGDVIVVKPNYRLGSLGFWSNHAASAPGNVGMWDVIAALQWVHMESEIFGADKNSVTIAGQGDGSVIVSLLSVSEFARGYYKRQIMQSGSALWLAMEDEEAAIKRSFAVAEKLGCANESFKIEDHPDDVELCMRRKSSFQIIEEEGKLNPDSASSIFPRWGDELLPRKPREMMLEGGFEFQELLIGNSGTEGLFKVPTQNPDLLGFFGEKDVLITREEGRDLLEKALPTSYDKHKFFDYYLPSGNDANKRSRAYEFAVADALGDYGLTCPMVYYAAVSVQSGKKVYYYDFQHRPKNSQWATWMGTTHFDEVDFIFGGPFKFQSRYSMEERVLSNMMIKHWTNFVKFGEPKEDWPLYGDTFETVVYNGTETPTTRPGPRLAACKHWRPYFDPENKTVLLSSQ